jgi:hypothetical protein
MHLILLYSLHDQPYGRKIGLYGNMIGPYGTLVGTFISEKTNFRESTLSKHADNCIFAQRHCTTQC